MSRKVLNYRIEDDGRDNGKMFVITEMPPSKSEKWAMRAILALMEAGIDLPEGFESMGMAGLAEVGIKSLSHLRWEVVEPLMDEMWSCVAIIPDPSKPQIVRPLIESDIEEVLTRIKIRKEILGLHMDFSKAVARLKSMPQAAAVETGQNTKTLQR